MWSSRATLTRRAILLGGASALAGCGFVPAFGTGGAARALQGQVSVTGPDTVEGFRLRTRLEDRLGPATDSAPYTLAITLRVEREGAAISSDGATTRFSLAGTATYSLRDRATGGVITEGSVDSFTAYSTSGSTVAVEAAREDALNRLAVIVADLIVTRLLTGTP